MNDLVSRLAMLTAAASLLASRLPADETTEPSKPPRPTLEDILALQARLEDVKSSDLPDDRKMAEAHKLKMAIADALQKLRDRKAPPEAAEPAPDPKAPSDLYFRGWLLSRDAEELAHAQKPEEALEKLDRARNLFDFVARVFPDWKPEMVKGRRAQTAETLARLSKQVSPPQPK